MFVIQPYTQRAMVFGGRAHILFVGGGRAFDDRFYCPITLQLLVEPVLTEDGHHYEKHAIQKHFRMLGSFSPLTKQGVNPNIAILDLVSASISASYEYFIINVVAALRNHENWRRFQ